MIISIGINIKSELLHQVLANRYVTTTGMMIYAYGRVPSAYTTKTVGVGYAYGGPRRSSSA